MQTRNLVSAVPVHATRFFVVVADFADAAADVVTAADAVPPAIRSILWVRM